MTGRWQETTLVTRHAYTARGASGHEVKLLLSMIYVLNFLRNWNLVLLRLGKWGNRAIQTITKPLMAPGFGSSKHVLGNFYKSNSRARLGGGKVLQENNGLKKHEARKNYRRDLTQIMAKASQQN